ncbi:S1C family serine protease, partial [Methanoculleus chikugoensis]|uniref:S1C family serine protease n=1 Tax=Methanoculleus chikugoensis TaxID=118126 RepID=UPI001FB542A2
MGTDSSSIPEILLRNPFRKGTLQAPPIPGESDADLLDAYSRAVVRVVESVGPPAVVSVVVGGKNSPGWRGEQVGAGSGVAVSPEGYILTNNHVVQGAGGRIEICTADGTALPARLVGG